MQRFFKKLKRGCVFTEPFEYIYYRSIIKLQEYDRLYENIQRLDGDKWTEWKNEYKLEFNYYEDVQAINFDYDCIALWFFSDRSDRSSKTDIELYHAKNQNNIRLPRDPNSFLFFKREHTRQIRIHEKQKRWKLLQRPCIQFNFSTDIYDSLAKELRNV